MISLNRIRTREVKTPRVRTTDFVVSTQVRHRGLEVVKSSCSQIFVFIAVLNESLCNVWYFKIGKHNGY